VKGFCGELTVLPLSDNGIQCATAASTDAPFWLPRSLCDLGASSAVGRIETVIVPGLAGGQAPPTSR